MSKAIPPAFDQVIVVGSSARREANRCTSLVSTCSREREFLHNASKTAMGSRVGISGYDLPALSAELRGSSEAGLSVPPRLTFLSLHCSPVLSSSQRVTGARLSHPWATCSRTQHPRPYPFGRSSWSTSQNQCGGSSHAGPTSEPVSFDANSIWPMALG